jgi:hypothetical protein
MAKRTDWSRKLPRPLKVPGVINLKTLADVRTPLGHLLKETRAKPTWQIVETKLMDAAADGDIVELFVTLRTVLQLEKVVFQEAAD